MKRAILIGAAVILVFSVWPLRSVNAFCCIGVSLGGFVAANRLGKSRGGTIDSTVGLRAGGLAGVLASLLAVGITLIGSWFFESSVQVDSIPAVVYEFVYRMWGGFIDIPPGSGSRADDPGFLWRVLFQIPTNALFGSFGGAVAASMFGNAAPRTAS